MSCHTLSLPLHLAAGILPHAINFPSLFPGWVYTKYEDEPYILRRGHTGTYVNDVIISAYLFRALRCTPLQLHRDATVHVRERENACKAFQKKGTKPRFKAEALISLFRNERHISSLFSASRYFFCDWNSITD